MELIGAGQDGPIPHPNGPGFNLRGAVEGGDSINLVKVNLRVVQEELGPLENLLGGLDEEIKGAGELVLAFAEDGSGPHVDGAVDIMAAGVHHTGDLGAGGHGGVLLDGQGVNIPPEDDGAAGAGLGALNLKEKASLPHPFQAVVSHILLDVLLQQRAGVVLLHAQLRIFVDVVAHGGDLRGDLLHRFADVDHGVSLLGFD